MHESCAHTTILTLRRFRDATGPPRRTFAVYPAPWTWLENQCDEIVFRMQEPGRESPDRLHPLFVYGPRVVAEKSGSDVGVFRLFHPKLDPAQDPMPQFDTSGMYFLISSTLMCEEHALALCRFPRLHPAPPPLTTERDGRGESQCFTMHIPTRPLCCLFLGFALSAAEGRRGRSILRACRPAFCTAHDKHLDLSRQCPQISKKI